MDVKKNFTGSASQTQSQVLSLFGFISFFILLLTDWLIKVLFQSCLSNLGFDLSSCRPGLIGGWLFYLLRHNVELVQKGNLSPPVDSPVKSLVCQNNKDLYSGFKCFKVGLIFLDFSQMFVIFQHFYLVSINFLKL